MYHHIQTLEQAQQTNSTYLTVTPETFAGQMDYLAAHGYQVIGMQQLVDFLEQGISLPAKAVLLTFDDGYEDFYTQAYPILRDRNLKATVFLATGLMDNPEYLRWDNIKTMNGQILFANHTWSHKNMLTDQATMEKEILLADQQLAVRGLNSPKIFSYPYGLSADNAKNILFANNYKLAFTTNYGTIHCQKLFLGLPRVRIGNTTMNAYGF